VHCIERLKNIPADVYAITTHDTSFDELKPIADAHGWGCLVAGPEGDVLKCLRNAAEYYGVETVVRATGDNPLVNAELFTWLLYYHMREEADLTSVEGADIGSCGDIISRRALILADGFAETRNDREHVTPFMRTWPEGFKIHTPRAPAQWRGDRRLTVDTPEDYEAIKRYF
jgi:spore coat polysaccharide biosynthesis protein SpsF